MEDEVPLYDPTKVVGPEVLDPIGEVLRSGWLTLGDWTKRFERRFANLHDSEFGIAVNSCTSALYASLRALGISDGDTVVVPAMTFSAAANVVRLLGGEVVLCDVKDNGNIDPSSLRRIIRQYDVSAVVPVHLYGLPCDIIEVIDIAEKWDIHVVEDCAHAPGAKVDGRPVGSFGEAGCFSFYATKNLTTGEGGMVVANDPSLSEEIRKLRNHHQTKSPETKQYNWGYDVDGLGFNFRMSEIAAAIGVSQLERLDAMNQSRKQVAERYQNAIGDIEGLTWEGGHSGLEHVFHLFVVHVLDEYPLDRDGLYDELAAKNIRTAVHYPPISELDFYSDIAGEYANAEALYGRILSLPMYPDMERKDQRRVIQALEAL